MKKYLFIVLMLALVLTPVLSQATTNGGASTVAELQALIAKLQAQIKVLQQQQSQQKVAICVFSNDLSLGDGEGDGLTTEISALHKVLISGGHLNIPKPTGWYGKLTSNAVRNWQLRNGLAPTGVIGEKERAVLCGNLTSTPAPVVYPKVEDTTSQAPKIVSVNYIEGKYVADIKGYNLQAARVYFKEALINKEDHTYWTNDKISFVLPTYQPGTYPVYVTSAYGRSNTVYLAIEGSTTQAPTCVLTSNKSSYSLGENILFSWTSKDTYYASWKQDLSSKDTLSLPSDKLSASGSQSVVANVVGNPTATLLVDGYNGTGSCSKTVNISSQVQAPTLSYVNPTFAEVGFTIHVYGSNFGPNTYVTFDNSGVPVWPNNTPATGSTGFSFNIPSYIGPGYHTLQVGEKGSSYPLSKSVAITITSVNQILPVTVDQSSLITLPNKSFVITGKASSNSPLLVAIVGPNYLGSSSFTTISNLLKNSGSYTAVSNNAVLSNGSWSASFGGLPEGATPYTVFIYDGAGNLITSGNLLVTYKG